MTSEETKQFAQAQSNHVREKFRLKMELEELTHKHIMEEIAAAAKAGVPKRGRTYD